MGDKHLFPSLAQLSKEPEFARFSRSIVYLVPNTPDEQFSLNSKVEHIIAVSFYEDPESRTHFFVLSNLATISLRCDQVDWVTLTVPDPKAISAH